MIWRWIGFVVMFVLIALMMKGCYHVVLGFISPCNPCG